MQNFFRFSPRHGVAVLAECSVSIAVRYPGPLGRTRSRAQSNHPQTRQSKPGTKQTVGDVETIVQRETTPAEGTSEQPVSALEFDPKRSYRETRAAFEADFERRYVGWLLGRHNGNISAAAREAKMDRKHLYDLARKHGLRGERGSPAGS